MNSAITNDIELLIIETGVELLIIEFSLIFASKTEFELLIIESSIEILIIEILRIP